MSHIYVLELQLVCLVVSGASNRNHGRVVFSLPCVMVAQQKNKGSKIAVCLNQVSVKIDGLS